MKSYQVLSVLSDVLQNLTENYDTITYVKSKGMCFYIHQLWRNDRRISCRYYETVPNGGLPFGCTSVANLVKKLFVMWPNGTAHQVYPIPAFIGYKCVDAAEYSYNVTQNKWEGEQLQLRLALLKFMLDTLKNLFTEEPNDGLA